MGEPAELFKPKAKASFADALASSKGEAKPAAKKSSVPPLATTEEIKKAVDEYQDAKTNMKQAEAVMGQAAEVLTSFVREHQDAEGYRGKYSNSYALAGNRHAVKVIYANKFSITAEDEGKLAEILGENFDACIDKRFTVKLRGEIFEDEAKQTRLMELMGDSFAEFFETTWTLSARPELDAEVYRLVPQDQLDSFRLFARQYKPVIR